ncbi:prolyl oligopeptidase family-domain-containing protein [Polychytrium aggregatum]|uniref:prolyl oligopeptidase family-domain-containing protein n=1 Tax=Polychytrium aggregatum TaxID=110093 RepID=UPI0022FEF158|nr:prolyl oligopeptidase family-domain-containing protein [Polychytrium aggregatum]KAI9201938.1 prolyl oligopeptidase family-domain-containing protein [Polychytrium aggregatum]
MHRHIPAAVSVRRSLASAASPGVATPFHKRSFFRRPRLPSRPWIAPQPSVEAWHGHSRIDPFPQLLNLDRKDARAYLQQEMLWAEAELAKCHRPSIARQLQRMSESLRHPKPATPLRLGQFEYRYAHRPGVTRLIRTDLVTGTERTIFDSTVDVGRGPLGSKAWSLQKLLVSLDHRHVAFLVIVEGSEDGTLFVHEADQRSVVKTISNVFNFVWGGDRLFYTRLDSSLRSSQVYAAYTDNRADIQIYHETDPSVFLDVGVTKDNTHLALTSGTSDASEVRMADLSAPDITWTLIRNRQPGVRYFVDHHQGQFYVLHNIASSTFRLACLPARSASPHPPQPQTWTSVVDLGPDSDIEEIEIFSEYLALFVKGDRPNCNKIVYFKMPSNISGSSAAKLELAGEVSLPELPAFRLSSDVNANIDEHRLRFLLSSPLVPESSYCYDMKSHTIISASPRTVPGFSSSDYTATVLSVPSGGVDVPVTLLHHKSVRWEGSHPTIMYFYGAYGVSLEYRFLLDFIPLLSRGYIIAFAHIRGGGELGTTWHEDGRLYRKSNSVCDVIAVADHLIKHQHTHPDRLGAISTSAGCLSLGAAINRRPDLFKAVVMRVPFLDPLTAMLDEASPLTQVEQGEWGDPIRDPAAYRSILSYSPYDTIPANANRTERSPTSILITACTDDQRVSFSGILRYAARLRELDRNSSAQRRLIVQISETGGHVSASSNISQIAREVSFLDHELGQQ